MNSIHEMGSKRNSKLAVSLIFLVNLLLLFTFAIACHTCPPRKGHHHHHPPGSYPPFIPTPGSNPGGNSTGTCPRDALKLGVCADVLRGLIGATIGNPRVTPCCSLIEGLVDLEAAVCLCTAIRANVLGTNLNIPVTLTLLLNVCSRDVPPGFQCP